MIVSIRGSNWPYPDDDISETQVNSHDLEQQTNGVAMRYVKALQEGNCDEAIARTLWMNERIEHARLKNPEQIAEIREELCRSLTDRRIEGNRLAEEGIEDHYVMAPGSRATPVRVDEGRDDLERPTASRVWVEVVYPKRERAPLDLNGVPIRRLVAGINVTADSYVLKASVIGNMEIDLDSISTNWNGNPGEK